MIGAQVYEWNPETSEWQQLEQVKSVQVLFLIFKILFWIETIGILLEPDYLFLSFAHFHP
jgi:hypothetical protein